MVKLIKDKFGRVWPYPRTELCRVCKQPDSCEDCNHQRLGDVDVRQILGENEFAELYPKGLGNESKS